MTLYYGNIHNENDRQGRPHTIQDLNMIRNIILSHNQELISSHPLLVSDEKRLLLYLNDKPTTREEIVDSNTVTGYKRVSIRDMNLLRDLVLEGTNNPRLKDNYIFTPPAPGGGVGGSGEQNCISQTIDGEQVCLQNGDTCLEGEHSNLISCEIAKDKWYIHEDGLVKPCTFPIGAPLDADYTCTNENNTQLLSECGVNQIKDEGSSACTINTWQDTDVIGTINENSVGCDCPAGTEFQVHSTARKWRCSGEQIVIPPLQPSTLDMVLPQDHTTGSSTEGAEEGNSVEGTEPMENQNFVADSCLDCSPQAFCIDHGYDCIYNSSGDKVLLCNYADSGLGKYVVDGIIENCIEQEGCTPGKSHDTCSTDIYGKLGCLLPEPEYYMGGTDNEIVMPCDECSPGQYIEQECSPIHGQYNINSEEKLSLSRNNRICRDCVYQENCYDSKTDGICLQNNSPYFGCNIPDTGHYIDHNGVVNACTEQKHCKVGRSRNECLTIPGYQDKKYCLEGENGETFNNDPDSFPYPGLYLKKSTISKKWGTLSDDGIFGCNINFYSSDDCSPGTNIHSKDSNDAIREGAKNADSGIFYHPTHVVGQEILAGSFSTSGYCDKALLCDDSGWKSSGHHPKGWWMHLRDFPWFTDERSHCIEDWLPTALGGDHPVNFTGLTVSNDKEYVSMRKLPDSRLPALQTCHELDYHIADDVFGYIVRPGHRHSVESHFIVSNDANCPTGYEHINNPDLCIHAMKELQELANSNSNTNNINNQITLGNSTIPIKDIQRRDDHKFNLNSGDYDNFILDIDANHTPKKCWWWTERNKNRLFFNANHYQSPLPADTALKGTRYSTSDTSGNEWRTKRSICTKAVNINPDSNERIKWNNNMDPPVEYEYKISENTPYSRQSAGGGVNNAAVACDGDWERVTDSLSCSVANLQEHIPTLTGDRRNQNVSNEPPGCWAYPASEGGDNASPTMLFYNSNTSERDSSYSHGGDDTNAASKRLVCRRRIPPAAQVAWQEAACQAGRGDNYIEYGGYTWRTLDGVDPATTDEGCQCTESSFTGLCSIGRGGSWGNNFLSLPPGWVLAPNDATSIAVASAHGWGTRCVVMADGTSWGTALDGWGGAPGEECTKLTGGSSRLVTSPEGDAYTVKACNFRVLARCG